jgi:twitching motility protein PilT
MTIQELLKKTIDIKASDLHLIVGVPPYMRIQGELSPVEDWPALDAALVKQMVLAVMSAEQQKRYLETRELDFSVAMPGLGRFRCNAYFQKQSPAINFRTIGEIIPTIDELKLPRICHTFATLKQGFVLVTGPTGTGKSSTLAAIIDEININRAEHIVTIEDPVEFIYANKKSIISQREIGGDTLGWTAALKSVFREDPNVVLVGEMRDTETMAAAITVAETGHLVFATLHTNSAAQTVDRIIDSFPKDQQEQIRLQLSNSLEAVFSQRLIPAISGGRIPACEVMVATPAIRNTIREAKTHQIDSIIQTSAELGMMTLETSLAYWVNQGVVEFSRAREYSTRPAELERLVKK